MTCASIELIEAMAGIAPHRSLDGYELSNDWKRWCGDETQHPYESASASEGWAATADGTKDAFLFLRINCPACLVAMDAAREGRILRPLT